MAASRLQPEPTQGLSVSLQSIIVLICLRKQANRYQQVTSGISGGWLGSRHVDLPRHQVQSAVDSASSYKVRARPQSRLEPEVATRLSLHSFGSGSPAPATREAWRLTVWHKINAIVCSTGICVKNPLQPFSPPTKVVSLASILGRLDMMCCRPVYTAVLTHSTLNCRLPSLHHVCLANWPHHRNGWLLTVREMGLFIEASPNQTWVLAAVIYYNKVLSEFI